MSNQNETQKKIDNILKVLVTVVQRVQDTSENIGLFSGLSGDLLFLWNASRYKSEFVNEEIFTRKLDFLQENISDVDIKLSLSEGLTGVGWFLEYINQAQLDDYNPELCEDIDDVMTNTLAITPWNGEIEMVSGLAGLSVYGAKRLHKTEQTIFYEKLIGHFEALATQSSDQTITWSQPRHSAYRIDTKNRERTEFNLGLAHGIPGIIASLLPALMIPSLFERTKTLLVQSCDWLLQQQLDSNESMSLFPSSSHAKSSSRLGWCYGDLTIALTLYRVGKALGIKKYLNVAEKISLHSSNRGQEEAFVKDTGICHGSAGLALIFNLLYNESGNKELMFASNKWLDFTLKVYDERGLEGFYRLSGDNGKLNECTGFLEGYAGIGLCLVALVEGKADWTDCLLLS